MPRHALSLVMLLALLPNPGWCLEPLAMPEAENYNDAIGNMKYMGLINDVVGEECSARVPRLKREVSIALATWKKNEARAIKRADAYWTALSAQDASLDTLLKEMKQSLRGQVAALSTRQTKGADSELATFCMHHFKDVAAGTWRKNTPQLHHYLEEEM